MIRFVHILEYTQQRIKYFRKLIINISSKALVTSRTTYIRKHKLSTKRILDDMFFTFFFYIFFAIYT